jgi:hypothetical protein
MGPTLHILMRNLAISIHLLERCQKLPTTIQTTGILGMMSLA